MNATRPKSKLWKRRNKAKAAARKAPLLEALAKAKKPTKAALKGPKVKTPPKKKVAAKTEPKPAAKKTAAKKAPAKAKKEQTQLL